MDIYFQVLKKNFSYGKLQILFMAVHQSSINYSALVSYIIKEKLKSLLTGLLVILIFLGFITFQLYKNGYFKKTDKRLINKTLNPIKIGKDIKIYEVKEGDYLWKIAEEQYGSGFNAYDIASANKIIDPNNLIKGQKIVIPRLSPKESTVGEVSSLSTSEVIHKGDTYVVQEGDFLWSIAFKVYGDGYATERIIKANNIPNINILEPGMVLKIPR